MSPASINLLQGLAGAGLFAAAGLLLTACTPGLEERGPWVRLAWSYLAGVTLVGALLWAGSHGFGLPLRSSAILPLWGALAVAGGVVATSRRWRLGGRPAAPPRPSPSPGEVALITAVAALGLVLTLGVLAEAATNPVADVDGRVTWVAHARYLRQEATVSPDALRSGPWLAPHPRYPKLLPLAQVAQLELWRSADERAMRPLYALFLPVLLLLVYDGGTRLAGRRAAALAAATVAVLPFIAFAGDGGAAGAYSDLPLACLWGGGLLLLIAGPRRPATALVAGALLAGGVLTKDEGAPLAALALAAAALVQRSAPAAEGATAPSPLARLAARLRLPALAAVPVAGAWALLATWRRGIPPRYQEDYLAGLHPERLPEALSRLPEIAAEAGGRMLDAGDWLFHWPLLAVLLLAGWRGWRSPEGAALALPVAGAMGVYLLAYLGSPWGEQLGEQVRVTWSRFLVQLAVPLHLLLALALGDLLERARGGTEAAP